MAQEIGNSNLLEVWATSGQVVEPDISKIEDGWQLGEQPPHEFMNWLQNTFGAKLNHILSNGSPEWNSTTSFTAGSIAKRTGNVWIAMQPNSNSEPADGNVNWSRLLKLADATADATADKLAVRDANGTFKVGAPTDPEHSVRLADTDTEATADKLPIRDSGGTFKIGSATDPAHPATLEQLDALADGLQWLGTAVAETKNLMFDDYALYPPTDSSLFRYILLSEGLDGAGQYNDGILINETITGSGVERQVTAEINLPASPLHGQVIHLINSERSHLRPSETAGVFEQDQMQRITGNVPANGEITQRVVGAFSQSGATSPIVDGVGIGNAAGNLEFNSANSPGSRTSATTDGETRVKSVSAIYFLRVA